MRPRDRRILVVDDDPASCEVVSYFLKSLGYRVATAPDGIRALNMGDRDDIELVILDLHMPTFDGFEVLAMLREQEHARPLKVLALTGDDSTEVREEFESKGVDGFLTKPVDLDGLRDAVARLVTAPALRERGLYGRVLERRLHQEW